jgi:threonine dehydrogenase-like Zn-dependent dehydrogenase
MKAPSSVPEKALILMADILPTGFYGVKSALAMAQGTDISQSTMVIIGAGPVGCCAVLSALHFKPKHLFVVDSIDSRLEIVKKLGAEPLNFQTDPAGMKARIMEATEGRGADMIVEVVGLSPALRTAFELVRPFGVISSIGVHNAEVCWFSFTESHTTNALHRYPGLRPKDTSKLRALSGDNTADPEQARIFVSRWDDARYARSLPNHLISWNNITRNSSTSASLWKSRTMLTLPSFMFDKIMPLSDAATAYDLFDKRQVQKVVFTV